MARTYERVRVDGRTFILRDPHITTTGFLVGTEVNREGDEVLREGAIQYHVIDPRTVSKRTRMVMDNHYGTLEPKVRLQDFLDGATPAP